MYPVRALATIAVMSAAVAQSRQDELPPVFVVVSTATPHAKQMEPFVLRVGIHSISTTQSFKLFLENNLRVEKQNAGGDYDEVWVSAEPVCGAFPRVLLTPKSPTLVFEAVLPPEATAEAGAYRAQVVVVATSCADRRSSVERMRSASTGTLLYSVAPCAGNVAAATLLAQMPPQPTLRHSGITGRGLMQTLGIVHSALDRSWCDSGTLQPHELSRARTIDGVSPLLLQVFRVHEIHNALTERRYSDALAMATAEIAAGAPDSDCGAVLGHLANLRASAGWWLADSQASFDRVTQEYNQFLASHPRMASAHSDYFREPRAHRSYLPPSSDRR